MSSSKIYKQDPHFTPTSLVRRILQAAQRETEDPAAESLLGHDTIAVPAEAADAELFRQPVAAPASGDPELAADLEALRQEAYNLGMADLAAQYEAIFTQTIEAFAEACRKIDNQRRTLLDHNRGDLINLIIALSEKILRQELATPRNVIAATLQSALEQAIESEEFYVTLHPEDLAFAESRAPELIASIRGLERLVFKTDPSLSRGGCLLESTACNVDASIEGQLASVKEFLLEQPAVLPAAAPEPPHCAEPTGDSGLDLLESSLAPDNDT